jgi:type IV pilus assembly protein PilA
MSFFSSHSKKKACVSAGRQGFTLIELLLVIGIIAILAAVVIVAINPTKQLGDARNAQRRSDVKTILDAVYQYALDHNGSVPTGITTTAKWICKSGVNVDCDSDGVSLNTLTGSYVVALPSDPQSATATGTYYKIQSLSNGRITVTAPGAEQGASISVTR